MIQVTVFIVVALVVIGLAGIRIRQEYERGVVFRLGRFRSVRGPGLYWIIPVIEWQRVVDLRVTTWDVELQEVITKDSVTIKLNPVLWYRVVDPAKSILAVASYKQAVYELSLTTLRSVIGQHDLDEVLKEGEKMNEVFRKLVDNATENWGITVERFETKDVEIPENMRRVMAQAAEAIREKRARLIKAEAEHEASEKLSLGAQQIAKNPIALELRRMQMISEIGTDQSSTVVIMMPSDFVTIASEMTRTLRESTGKPLAGKASPNRSG